MFFRTIFTAAAVACMAFASGCTHTQWRQFHGCQGACGGCCHHGLRSAKCGSNCGHDCGPLFRGDGGKYFDSCDGCGDDCGLGVEPACGMPVETGCGIAVEPGCGMEACGGCRRHGIGCWQPCKLLREIFTCDGCTGPMYWSEWYNDPPECCEPCDHYGHYTGPQAKCSVVGVAHHAPLRQVPTPIGGDPYYDGGQQNNGKIKSAPSSPPPAPRETKMKSRVVPTAYVTPLNAKCNCAP